MALGGRFGCFHTSQCWERSSLGGIRKSYVDLLFRLSANFSHARDKSRLWQTIFPALSRESLERNVDFSASTQTRHRSIQRTGSSLRRKHGQDGGESSPSPGRGAGAHQTTMHVCSRRHADATGNENGTERRLLHRERRPARP